MKLGNDLLEGGVLVPHTSNVVQVLPFYEHLFLNSNEERLLEIVGFVFDRHVFREYLWY